MAQSTYRKGTAFYKGVIRTPVSLGEHLYLLPEAGVRPPVPPYPPDSHRTIWGRRCGALVGVCTPPSPSFLAAPIIAHDELSERKWWFLSDDFRPALQLTSASIVAGGTQEGTQAFAMLAALLASLGIEAEVFHVNASPDNCFRMIDAGTNDIGSAVTDLEQIINHKLRRSVREGEVLRWEDLVPLKVDLGERDPSDLIADIEHAIIDNQGLPQSANDALLNLRGRLIALEKTNKTTKTLAVIGTAALLMGMFLALATVIFSLNKGPAGGVWGTLVLTLAGISLLPRGGVRTSVSLFGHTVSLKHSQRGARGVSILRWLRLLAGLTLLYWGLYNPFVIKSIWREWIAGGSSSPLSTSLCYAILVFISGMILGVEAPRGWIQGLFAGTLALIIFVARSPKWTLGQPGIWEDYIAAAGILFTGALGGWVGSLLSTSPKDVLGSRGRADKKPYSHRSGG